MDSNYFSFCKKSISLCFLRRDERVSQRVSVSRALMDTNLEAPVTMREARANIRIYEKRSDKREIDSL